MLKQAYGEEALTYSSDFEWFIRFRDARKNVKNDANTSICTPEIIEKVRVLVILDHQLTIRVLAKELSILDEVAQ